MWPFNVGGGAARLKRKGCSPDESESESSVTEVRFGYGRHSRVRLRARCRRGGWVVVQSRGPFENPPDFFDRDWVDYHRGFGDEEGEYWMGLANLQMMTAHGTHELRVELVDADGNLSYAR